ncbi:MAG: single-stranded DNA-binding protein [Phycisphaerales bacterium]|nr:single-stranded DNA-binding protein [Phycisphaerales bacterium]
MTGFNRVILAGNLTRDPQIKYLPSNTAVCEFGLAMNRRWRDKDGNQHDEVCFVDCAAFGRQGEVINQYMSKGKQMLVEGRLKLDQWTAQDGTKKSRLSVVVENFTFLGGPGGPSGGEGGGQRGNYERGGQSRGPAENRPPADNRGSGFVPNRDSAPPPAADYETSYSSADAEPPPRNDDIPF